MRSASAQPVSRGMRLGIVAETGEWVVIDKPACLQAHPSKPSDKSTLWDLLRELLAYELANGGQVSIINRLDRETSGLTLIAKTKGAARRYGMMMERGGIRKEYLALVRGWPEREEWEIDARLARQGAHGPTRIYLKQCVHAAGAAARTRFRVERRFERGTEGRFALVRAWPETGRMHQIRVHLAHSGHAVVGDKIYARADALDPAVLAHRCRLPTFQTASGEEHYLRFIETGWTAELEEALLMRRHALHSAVLEAPEEGLRWEAPLPADMAGFMEAGGRA